MLNRQRVLLELLATGGSRLGRTAFVKLCFLAKHESPLQDDATFYDFLPYRYGPFSFALYHELAKMALRGLVIEGDDDVALSAQLVPEADTERAKLPSRVRNGLGNVLARYGSMTKESLLRSVYARYPQYANSSDIYDDVMGHPPSASPPIASPGIYTVGYAGRSIDAFMHGLLQDGIRAIIDVRSNPVSRKFGFSKSRLRDISARLGVDYHHLPALGVPSSLRRDLGSDRSYEELFRAYDAILAENDGPVLQAASIVEEGPAALLCAEANPHECHRSRLALALERVTGLETVHLGGCGSGTPSSSDHGQDVSDPIESAR